MGACASLPTNELESPNVVKNDDCVGAINVCQSLKQFLYSMIRSTEYDTISSNIQNIIDDYCHLIHKHDTDKDFEFIVDSLGKCDIVTCERFKRNYRNRNEPNNLDAQFIKMDTKDNAIREIFDKMHCYFAHCFEIGNRLSMNERALTAIHDDDEKMNYNDIKSLLVNNKVIKMKEILQTKLKNTDTDLRERITESNKYTQLMLQNEDHSKDTKTVNNDNILHSGYMFRYYDTATQLHADGGTDLEHIPILPIHSSLKEELTQNKICVITRGQFQNEYEKASLHFRSKHRELQYPKMKFEWLLVVSFYCNYSQLPYQFSKTYREHKGKDHCNFYFMGKYLQSALYNNENDAISIFSPLYHGISGKLMVVMSAQNNKHNNYDINIYCPLSTTSSFEVAVIFANNNQGIVVEFGSDELAVDYDDDADSFSSQDCEWNISIWKKRCLSCLWISDYGNEKEYLFVQSNSTFNVTNITNIDTGIEYSVITETLTLIDKCIKEPLEFTKGNMWALLMAEIVRYQLSFTLQELNAKTFGIDDYAKKLCKAHFERVTFIEMSWHIKGFDGYFVTIFELFYHSKQAINFKNIISLYPNLERIEAGCGDVCLNDNMLHTLLNDWMDIGTQTLKRLNISLERSTTIYTLINFVDKYSKQYLDIGLYITGFITANVWDPNIDNVVSVFVEISKRNRSDLLLDLIKRLRARHSGMIYLKDDENAINVENTIFPNVEQIEDCIRNKLFLRIYVKSIGQNRVLLFVTDDIAQCTRWYNTIKKPINEYE